MPPARPPIGLRIKRARERLRLTQEQLAGQVGVSQKTIDNWENDRTYPKSALGALEEVLGPLTDDTASTAGVRFPDWVAGDPFLEHIYEGPGTDTEKLVAARAVMTHREATGGTHRADEQRPA